jgi:hypothetical protein
VTHPDLPTEQAYVDRAYEYLERMRAIVETAANLADGEVAQAALDAWATRRLRTFEDAERGCASDGWTSRTSPSRSTSGAGGCTTTSGGRWS